MSIERNGNRMPDYEDMSPREQQEYLRSVFEDSNDNDIDNVLYLSTVSEELPDDEN